MKSDRKAKCIDGSCQYVPGCRSRNEKGDADVVGTNNKVANILYSASSRGFLRLRSSSHNAREQPGLLQINLGRLNDFQDDVFGAELIALKVRCLL